MDMDLCKLYNRQSLYTILDMIAADHFKIVENERRKILQFLHRPF